MMETLSPAANEVFTTAELLEQILLDLSPDRLLILKRVTKFWHAIITTSPPLQRILFQKPALNLTHRIHNPLFEDYFTDISCAEPSTSASESGGPPAHLKISPLQMKKLLHKCPQALRSMSMFQPPCKYWLTLPSASLWNFTVKFVNEADVPVVRAVERASMIVELESEKRRHVRRNLEMELRAGTRGAGMRHRQLGGNAGAVNA